MLTGFTNLHSTYFKISGFLTDNSQVITNSGPVKTIALSHLSRMIHSRSLVYYQHESASRGQCLWEFSEHRPILFGWISGRLPQQRYICRVLLWKARCCWLLSSVETEWLYGPSINQLLRLSTLKQLKKWQKHRLCDKKSTWNAILSGMWDCNSSQNTTKNMEYKPYHVQ